MRKYFYFPPFICCFVVTAIGWGQARSIVRFRLVRDYLIVAPVLINDAGPFDFVIDTGAKASVVDVELARQLALRPTGRALLKTATGSQVAPRARIDRLRLGPKAAEAVEVLCTSLGRLGSLDARIRGIVGQNVLSQFTYLFDYEDRRIEFDDDGALGDRLLGARLPVDRSTGRLLVAAQPSKSTRLRFILDSAAHRTFIFKTASRPLGLDIDQSGHPPMLTATLAGQRTMWAGRLRSLRLGDETLVNLPVLLVQSGMNDPRIEDGLLPTRLFRSIYFDHGRGFVVLNPRDGLEQPSSIVQQPDLP